jgi:hypothetical protein
MAAVPSFASMRQEPSGEITMTPSVISVCGEGGSSTFVVDSTEPASISNWHGEYPGTISQHSVGAGKTSLTVTLPENDRTVAKTYQLTWKTIGGATSTLTVSQAASHIEQKSELEEQKDLTAASQKHSLTLSIIALLLSSFSLMFSLLIKATLKTSKK